MKVAICWPIQATRNVSLRMRVVRPNWGCSLEARRHTTAACVPRRPVAAAGGKSPKNPVDSFAAGAVTPGPPRPQEEAPVPPSTAGPPGGVHVPRSPAAVAPPSGRRLPPDTKPFSDFLTDTFHRQHDYLRISVTERCNLRCLYCMPEEGVPLSPSRHLLTTPEIILLSSLFVSQGVTKIRLTGGEPTVRRDIVSLMQQIGALRRHGLRELCLTTNGLSLHRKLDAMVEAGLTGVNLSLDTLDPWQFQLMTRRSGFAAVQKSIDRILELNRAGAGIKFKINCVIMRGLNDREILPFVELTRDKDIEVRFIEYMPFDGNKWNQGKMFSFQEMLDIIRAKHPGLEKIRGHKNDTSKTFQVPGFAGKVGFITSMTHNFCGTCNRLRITSDGNLKVCLFGNAEVSLRDIIRRVNSGEPIDEEAFETLKKAAVDSIHHCSPSDRPPLLVPNSRELLDIIGMAVKRKKEKHAGIGVLEHMKNRPMILIDLMPTIFESPRPLGQTIHLARGWVPLLSPGVPTPSLMSAAQHQAARWGAKARLFSTTVPRAGKKEDHSTASRLTHISKSGTAHMVSIAQKAATKRFATAKCVVRFTNPSVLALILENQMKKGDVLGVARVAGIMAAKRTPDLIPLCHPIAISHVSIDLDLLEPSDEDGGGKAGGGIEVTATVSCDGKTGVEMEALTAASTAALTVYDMCKAVDKGMIIKDLRVVLKEGGKSGRWVEGAPDSEGQ